MLFNALIDLGWVFWTVDIRLNVSLLAVLTGWLTFPSAMLAQHKGMMPVSTGMVPEWVWPLCFGAVITATSAFCVSMSLRLRELEKSMREAQTQIKPFWAYAQSVIAADLHHDDEPVTDALIEKLLALTITPEERVVLDGRLMSRYLDKSGKYSEDERESAKLMVGIMKKVVIENAGIKKRMITVAMTLLVGVHSLVAAYMRYLKWG